MNPRAEAEQRLGRRYDARVLEPSPPAVTEPPWFADDPVARGDAVSGRLVVAPVSTGDVRWEQLAADDPDLAAWCPGAARFLGDWYGFAASVLEQLRAEASADQHPSRVQLWPEHFDLALELGREDAGHRAAYGCSPGDDQHPEPYVYVVPWVAPAPGELWQASGFAGAELPLARLLGAADQLGTALEFFRARVAALNSADS